MKKVKEFVPVRILRDEAHETRTRQEMEGSIQSLQLILDEWLSLGLGPCTDGINDLILRPRVMYDRAVSDMIKVPELSGPFKIDKAKYMDQLSLPDPSALYAACKKALQQPWCAVYGLWIVDDDKVLLNEEEAQNYIDSQSVYVRDPEKLAVAEKLTDFCRSFNELSEALRGEFTPPVFGWQAFFRGKFLLHQEDGTKPFTITVDPTFLRYVTQG
jgi:hypothetical protein